MSWACSTRTLLTTLPSGPVWGVTRVMPRIWSASLLHFLEGGGDLDAAALAPAPGVDLGLDHKGAFGQFFRHLAGFPGGRGHVALGHRHVEFLAANLWPDIREFSWEVLFPEISRKRIYHNI